MKLIETKTLASAAASIEFTSIPQDGTDLVVLMSLRSDQGTGTAQGLISFNNSTSNFSSRYLLGTGSSALSGTLAQYAGQVGVASQTSNTFSNTFVYIPNYTSSSAKSYSVDGVTENNASAANQDLIAGLWNDTSAINSVKITASGGNLVIGSTISLYKITKGSDGITTVA